MAHNFVRGFVSVLGGSVGSMLISIVLSPILVRVLGSSRYGQYALVLSVFGPLMILVNAGLFPGTRKFIGENPTDETWRAGVFGFYARVAIVLAVVGAGVVALVLGTGVIGSYLGSAFVPLFLVVVVMVPLHQSYILGRGTLMALGLEHYSEPISVLQQLCLKGLGLVFVAIGFGVAGALLGYAVGLFAAGGLSLLLVLRRIDVRSVIYPPAIDVSRRDLLGFNTLSVVHAFLVSSMLNADVFLIQLFQGNAQAGYYKAALVVSGFLWFVPRALKTVLLHSTSELWAAGRQEQISDRISRLTRYTLIIVTLLVLGLGTLAGSFVPVYYGADFTPVVEPLLLLLPGTLCYALARPIIGIGQAKGSLRILIAATGSGSVFNIVLNLLLIPTYGMDGAAISTSIGYGSMLLFHLVGARKIGFDPLKDLRVGRVVVSSTITAIVIAGLVTSLRSHIVSLVVVPPVGLIVYAVASIWIGAVRTEELVDIFQRLPAPMVRPLRRLL